MIFLEISLWKKEKKKKPMDFFDIFLYYIFRKNWSKIFYSSPLTNTSKVPVYMTVSKKYCAPLALMNANLQLLFEIANLFRMEWILPYQLPILVGHGKWD